MAVANKHPKNSRLIIAGSNLLVTELSTEDNVPATDVTNTESGGAYECGDEGGITKVEVEFTAILLAGTAPDVKAGETYAATLQHGAKDSSSAYSGQLYVENLSIKGQVTQNGPSVYTAKGMFTGTVTRP